jgi:drug/metabolite transporter (DMT)-like permease
LSAVQENDVAPRRDLTNLKAVLFMLGSIGFFSAMFASGRFVGEEASALQIYFLRFVGGFLTVLCVAIVRGRSVSSLRSRKPSYQVLRIFGGAFGGVALVYTNANMPIVDANAISQLSAIFLVVLGMVFLGERPRAWHFVAILVCVSGAATVMAARGAFSNFSPAYLVPASVALLGAMLMAFESLYIKLLTRVDDMLTTLMHANALGMLILLVPALLTWQSWGPINLALLALGPLAILAQYCTFRGFTLADVTLIAPVKYTGLIFAAAIGWIFFAEAPTLGVVLGACLIAAGGIRLATLQR